MRASKNFVLREIAGEYMLVPMGAAAADYNGLIVLNECGGIVFRALAGERTREELVDAVIGACEDPVDRETAAADVEEFLEQLRGIGALVEEA